MSRVTTIAADLQPYPHEPPSRAREFIRPCTCQRMTLPTQRRPRPSPTWMPRRCCRGRLPSWASTPQWILWTQPPVSWPFSLSLCTEVFCEDSCLRFQMLQYISQGMLDPSIVGQRHYDIARSTQKILQDYKSLQDWNFGAVEGPPNLSGDGGCNSWHHSKSQISLQPSTQSARLAAKLQCPQRRLTMKPQS